MTEKTINEINETELQEIMQQAKQSAIKPVELKPEEQKEIEETFSSVKDFRTL
jgi:hypothetical protein